MLRKEIKDAIKRFIESLCVLILIPFVYFVDKLVTKTGLDFASLINMGLVITLVISAVYTGATVFQSEKKDRAFEYLFSLPLTRSKIILEKILPRLGLLLILGGVATIFIGGSFLAETGIAVLVLFFSSLFLSLGVSSMIINLFGVIFMSIIFFQGKKAFGYLLFKLGGDSVSHLSQMLSQCFSAAVLLVPFGLAFWLTFKKMDVRPLNLQLKTYYSIILPTVFVLFSLAVLFFGKLTA